MKKILVTGASGLVGSRFIELFKGRYDFVTPEYPQFDLTNKEGVLKIVRSVNPDVIVNFAAYTNVSEAENQKGDESSPCWKINVEGVKNILDALPQKTHFIQISTDNVFPGSEKDPGPYGENHPIEYGAEELCWYGYTKNLAEKEVVKKFGKDATILRLIYPSRAKFDLKSDYLRKPLSLFDEGKLYPMFNDQQVSISFVDSIAEALDKIIEGGKRGIFHASSEDTGTPFEIITYLLEKARAVKNAVKPSSLAEFVKTVDNPVRYPKFGGLKVEKTEKELGIKFGNWKNIVDEFVGQLNSPSNT